MSDEQSICAIASSKCNFYIPNSVIKTRRKEWFWNLEVRKQEPGNCDRLITLTKLPLAELPPGLSGYVFVVGALFQSQDKPQEDGTQLYTGDGMVYRLGFEDGKPTLKTRIAKTPCYYADPATQFYLADNYLQGIPYLFKNISSYFVKKHKLFSYFAAFRNGGPSRFSIFLGSRNQLNTAFLNTKEHLLLTMDAGRAYQLDPDSMELIDPVGSTKDWFSIFPVISRFTWINTFETYVSSAHYVSDMNSLSNKQDELYTTNYSTGYNGKFKQLINWLLDSYWFKKVLRLLYLLLQQKAVMNREFGRFTYLIRYKFADKQKELAPIMERWRLVLPDGSPVLVEQSLHQLAITERYIILADIAFKMEFSQIFAPFVFGFLRLARFIKYERLGSWIYAIFLQAIKPLPFANLYIVNRQDLDKENQGDPTETIPENIPKITVQQVQLPREISHFAADYSNPDNKITLHVGHVNGWDVTEWITRYDQPVPGKSLRKDLEGMMVGTTDLGALGKYVVDGKTGEIESCKTVRDPKFTWSPSLYTHRNLSRDLLTETAKEVKNIYWLSLGFAWELIPERIYNAYKEDPRRFLPVEELPQENKPITLLRLDTEQMVIVDSYKFPAGTYVSSTQFVPSSLPCPEGVDESIHGFITCIVMVDPDDSNTARDEFWIFHADDFNHKPVYRLSASSGDEPLNIAMTIHSTWIPTIHQQDSKEQRCERRKKSVTEDYQHAIANKSKIVQELFEDIVYPNFIDQTLEEDFERFLSPKDK